MHKCPSPVRTLAIWVSTYIPCYFFSSLDGSTNKVNGCSPYFHGSELIDWLLEVGLVADRITAVHYGNSLLRGRVIRHCQNRYYFSDSNLSYEFCPGWDSERT